MRQVDISQYNLESKPSQENQEHQTEGQKGQTLKNDDMECTSVPWLSNKDNMRLWCIYCESEDYGVISYREYAERTFSYGEVYGEADQRRDRDIPF